MSELARKEEALPSPLDEYDELKSHVARLYGAGVTRAQIARHLVDHLVPNRTRSLEARIASARSKLKRWERQDAFRDAVYKAAIVQVDLDTPQILRGITKAAKRGRVDAARLALEVTGRHNPKGDSQPAQVIVAINGVPRPGAAQSPAEIVQEIKGEEVDDGEYTDD